jgi:hypothetical protein
MSINYNKLTLVALAFAGLCALIAFSSGVDWLAIPTGLAVVVGFFAGARYHETHRV